MIESIPQNKPATKLIEMTSNLLRWIVKINCRYNHLKNRKHLMGKQLFGCFFRQITIGMLSAQNTSSKLTMKTLEQRLSSTGFVLFLVLIIPEKKSESCRIKKRHGLTLFSVYFFNNCASDFYMNNLIVWLV